MATVRGYARVSTQDKQDTARQERELKAAGAEIIYTEHEHGQATKKKQLALMMADCKQGDTILVCEVSRLSRSTKQLCDIIDFVKENNLCLKVLNSITVDCRKGAGTLDPMTNAYIMLAGVFAELEVEMTRARVRSGMENARAQGKQIGRPTMTKDDLPEAFTKYLSLYQRDAINKSEFSRLSGISRPTIDKYLNLLES